MNSVNSIACYSSPQHFFSKRSLALISPQNSFSVRRRRSRTFRRRKKSDYRNPANPFVDTGTYSNDAISSDKQSLKLVLDVSRISNIASYKLERLAASTEDAFHDLKTLVTLDENNRIVFSCRKSTLRYCGVVLLCGFVLVSACRVFSRLWLGFRRRYFSGKQNVVVRRDRSLGGREVVVAVDDTQRREDVERKRSRASDNQFSIPGWITGSGMEWDLWRRHRVQSQQKLPKWWPVSVARNQDLVVNEEHKREANRLVRAITDYRATGKDVTESDVTQLRQICRASGVRVSFDTTNTRDAFYRASINFVLNSCSRAPNYSTSVEYNGENAQQFIAGLAENIGLEDIRAARMVSAAIAAWTRSSFLQAWALEVQGKHSEAVYELSKLCAVLCAFPPEESSPEMEMVARGLGKHLKLEQRELLMNMFTAVCCEDSHRTAADALGLTFSPNRVGDR